MILLAAALAILAILLIYYVVQVKWPRVCPVCGRTLVRHEDGERDRYECTSCGWWSEAPKPFDHAA